jgi:hypothetical protein
MVALPLPDAPALHLVERQTPALYLVPKQHTLNLDWHTDNNAAVSIHRKLNRMALTDALVWKRYKLVYIEPLHYSEDFHAYYVLYYRHNPIAVARVCSAHALTHVRRRLASRLAEYGFDDSAAVVPCGGLGISALARFHRVPQLA